MVAPFFFAIGKSILGVLQQTHAELRHAKLHRLEAPLMKTLPQRINFAAMQHKFTENRYKSGIFCIPLPKLTTLSIGRSMRLEM